MDKEVATPLVSVIVPVYNVEKYLTACIGSIVSQTYPYLEIILVDDGSTDSSGAICDRLKETDSRIKVIHKTNGGLSDARNCALDVMTGDYVCFVDSDDMIAPDNIDRLFGIMTEFSVEIAACGFHTFLTEDDFAHLEAEDKVTRITSKDLLISFFTDGEFPTSACGKLYKASLWNDIRFPKGKLYEDLMTTWRTVVKVSYIGVTSAPMYYYRCNESGIINSPFKEKNLDIITAHEYVLSEIDNYYPEFKLIVRQRLGRIVTVFFIRAVQTGYKDKKGIKALQNVVRKQFMPLMTSHASWRLRMLGAMLAVSTHMATVVCKMAPTVDK